MNTMMQCDDCGLALKRDLLPPAKRISERIEPGGVYTDKECPNCGALCYPLDAEKEVPESKVTQELVIFTVRVNDNVRVVVAENATEAEEFYDLSIKEQVAKVGLPYEPEHDSATLTRFKKYTRLGAVPSTAPASEDEILRFHNVLSTGFTPSPSVLVAAEIPGVGCMVSVIGEETLTFVPGVRLIASGVNAGLFKIVKA